MTERGITLFDTAVGRCGLAWGPAGLTAVALPEASPGETLARLRRKGGAGEATAPPAAVQATIAAIAALLRGERRDLAEIALDMDGVPAFHRRVYELARGIPPGRTLTYGEVAARLGEPGAARAVGQALGRNPFPIVVPCHRVLAAGGRPGGFSAPGGLETKFRLLVIEGAVPPPAPSLFEAAGLPG